MKSFGFSIVIIRPELLPLEGVLQNMRGCAASFTTCATSHLSQSLWTLLVIDWNGLKVMGKALGAGR